MPKSFEHLKIANWRQFRDIDISFHDRLTVLTGANGAGKTTVLNLLSRHFGWQGTIVSTPKRNGSRTEFSSDYWSEEDRIEFAAWLEHKRSPSMDASAEQPLPPSQPEGKRQPIGSLTYGGGFTAILQVPISVGSSFQIEIQGQREQRGMHIPSHRPIFSYQSVENIPTVPRRRDQAFGTYIDIVRSRYYGGHHQRTPNYYMKETLIALAAFGYGNQVIEPDAESLETFNGFQDVLSTVLPPSLGFRRLSIRLPEVVLVTRSGEFSLDAVSGGIASLIDLAWQIYMYAKADTPFAITLDEPENHLHPELQRTVLGTLLKAFPNTQFICATHNPFIVTSVPESHVYALRYGDDHRVVSELLSSADRTGSSNEILRDVLGLPSSYPTWVEATLDDVQSQLLMKDLTAQTVADLRARLTEVGLERFVPTILARLAQKKLSDDKA